MLPPYSTGLLGDVAFHSTSVPPDWSVTQEGRGADWLLTESRNPQPLTEKEFFFFLNDECELGEAKGRQLFSWQTGT